MRFHTRLRLLVVTLLLSACDERDDSFEWAAKPHAVSPSGWCVAYVQENPKPDPAGWSAVLLDLDQGRGSVVAVEFHQRGLPLEMRWLSPDTLEVRYPRTAQPSCPAYAAERVVEFVGRRVHIVPRAM